MEVENGPLRLSIGPTLGDSMRWFSLAADVVFLKKGWYWPGAIILIILMLHAGCPWGQLAVVSGY